MARIFKNTSINVGESVAVNAEDIDFLYVSESNDNINDSAGNSSADSASMRKAEGIISNANMEARKIIEAAKMESEAIKISAREEGYQQGYQQGLYDGKSETEDLAHQALSIKEELEFERNNLVKTIENQVIDLIIQSVNKIINCELITNKEIIKNVVCTALDKISSGENIVICVSEQDFKSVEDNKYKIISQCDNLSNFDIKKDLSLEVGDCIIETNCGSINASVEKQLQKYESTISKIIGNDDDVE